MTHIFSSQSIFILSIVTFAWMIVLSVLLIRLKDTDAVWLLSFMVIQAIYVIGYYFRFVSVVPISDSSAFVFQFLRPATISSWFFVCLYFSSRYYRRWRAKRES